ncbi:hypothetical protein F3N42_13260 [Marinihelvus fidelis]|uniref:Lipoprotein n=1 Tax=Marinihelvus fidelis TaxID=2613842 RepID=A0A5N0T659_9GAMM|nr:hypothetical protein [Marinihelvus fidelis]KAA9130301.1 hypothetical protein F3N42_13260 [Marinihelvus fidelis]
MSAIRLHTTTARVLFGLLLLAMSGCVRHPIWEAPEEARVWFDGEWIVYEGPLSEEANGEALALFDQHPGAGLRIISGGGPITAGMDLGQWILVRGLTVYVDQYCYSSCANYIFPAGRQRRLAPGAELGWHGGTLQWDSAEAMCESFKPEEGADSADYDDCVTRANGEREREVRFFELAGVEQRITILGFADGAGYPSRKTDTAWTYSLDDMARLGMTDIQVDGNGTWEPVDPPGRVTMCRMSLDNMRCLQIP